MNNQQIEDQNKRNAFAQTEALQARDKQHAQAMSQRATQPPTDFETAVKHAAERAVLKIISEGNWVQPDYGNRFQLPKEFMADIWQLVDHEKVKLAMVARIEAELADRIVNHLAAEMATDIKQILSDKERREALRAVARENIDRICKA